MSQITLLALAAVSFLTIAATIFVAVMDLRMPDTLVGVSCATSYSDSPPSDDAAIRDLQSKAELRAVDVEILSVGPAVARNCWRAIVAKGRPVPRRMD